MFRLRGILLISAVALSCSPVAGIRNASGLDIVPELESISEGTSEVSLDFESQQDTTPVLTDGSGARLFLMKAGLDYDGEMVATDELVPAIVRSRFSNVAERQGMVSLYFSITVPDVMLDGKWRVSLFPKLCYGPDTVALKPLVITGQEFGRLQTKGYLQYEQYRKSIEKDSSEFVRSGELGIFLARNSMKHSFLVPYPVAEYHYTNHLEKGYNSYRRSRLGDVFDRYVKNPAMESYSEYIYDGSSPSNSGGYRYGISVGAIPGVRKAVVTISGRIEKWGDELCEIPETEGFTFFISSLSSLAVDDNPSDSLYSKGVEAIRLLEYSRACEILSNYRGFNYALALMAAGRSEEAMRELQTLPQNAREKYLEAIALSIEGRDSEATGLYGEACRMDRFYISRGNIDPEILRLINKYNLL